MRQEALKLVGTAAEAVLSEPTPEQKEFLNRSELAKHIGTEYYLGTVQGTGNRIAISYIDRAEWELAIITCAGSNVLFQGISGIAPYAEFQFPVMQLLLVLGVTGGICIFIPSFLYKKTKDK